MERIASIAFCGVFFYGLFRLFAEYPTAAVVLTATIATGVVTLFYGRDG